MDPFDEGRAQKGHERPKKGLPRAYMLRRRAANDPLVARVCKDEAGLRSIGASGRRRVRRKEGVLAVTPGLVATGVSKQTRICDQR